MKHTNTIQAIILVSAATSALTSCSGPVNEQTTKGMPTGYLCRLLDSHEYITTPSVQRAIYTELDNRGEECVDNVQKVITTTE